MPPTFGLPDEGREALRDGGDVRASSIFARTREQDLLRSSHPFGKGAILSLALNSEPCQVTVGKADLPTDRRHSRRFRIELMPRCPSQLLSAALGHSAPKPKTARLPRELVRNFLGPA